MKHMNYKLQRLLHEGFSMGTLEKLSNGQLNLLYGKIMEQKGSVRIPSDKADPAKIKSLTDQGINVEMGEDLEDPMDFEKGQRTQSPKQVGPGTDDGQDSYGDGTPTESEIYEKAVSKKQRGLMGAAYSVEKGYKDLKDIPKSYRNKVKDVVDSMTKKQIKDFASTSNDEMKNEEYEVKKLEESILSIVQKHIPTHFTKGELLRNFRNRI